MEGWVLYSVRPVIRALRGNLSFPFGYHDVVFMLLPPEYFFFFLSFISQSTRLQTKTDPREQAHAM